MSLEAVSTFNSLAFSLTAIFSCLAFLGLPEIWRCGNGISKLDAWLSFDRAVNYTRRSLAQYLDVGHLQTRAANLP